MNNSIKQVLLVEDNPDDRELIRLAFDEAGISCEITIVEDGQQVIDYLFGKNEFEGRNVKDIPDLILLDLRLPKLTGFEVLEKIREGENTRFIPVVVFTSSNIPSDMMTSYQIGANSTLSKPIESQQFMECVKLLAVYWLIWNRSPPQGWSENRRLGIV
jgi:two-component system response regulator